MNKNYYRDTCKTYLKEKAIKVIKEVCELHGEDKEFTEEYILDRLKAYENNLGVLIDCFEDLKKQAIEVYGLTF